MDKYLLSQGISFRAIETMINDAKELFKNNEVLKSCQIVQDIEYTANRLAAALSWDVLKTVPHRELWEATDEEVEKLSVLNNKFEILQEQTIQHVISVEKEMDQKPLCDSEFMTEYEIDVNVWFMTSDMDPLSSPESDNFIAEIKYASFFKRLDDDSIYDNYNDFSAFFPNEIEHPLFGQKHCLFFHEFLNHLSTPRLSLDDILRVEEIWIDVIVRHQNIRNIKTLKPV